MDDNDDKGWRRCPKCESVGIKTDLELDPPYWSCKNHHVWKFNNDGNLEPVST